MKSLLKVIPFFPNVIKIILNRPQKRNALSMALMKELLEVLSTLPLETRVVIIEGEGSFFCAGLDLEEASHPLHHEFISDWFLKILKKLTFLPFTTIAYVHGGALAGGLGLMAACDLAIAGREAVFSLPELRRGLVPAMVHILLKQQVLPRFLQEMILLAEPITAVRAHAIGLINRVISDEEKESTLHHFVQQILKSAPEATKTYKKHLLHPADLEESFLAAFQLHSHVRGGKEAEEGMNAFLEKRPPHWQ